MAEIINLNKHRKRRLKDAQTAKAAQNRRKFGRRKAEKQADKDAPTRLDRHLDGSKIDENPDE